MTSTEFTGWQTLLVIVIPFSLFKGSLRSNPVIYLGSFKNRSFLSNIIRTIALFCYFIEKLLIWKVLNLEKLNNFVVWTLLFSSFIYFNNYRHSNLVHSLHCRSYTSFLAVLLMSNHNWISIVLDDVLCVWGWLRERVREWLCFLVCCLIFGFSSSSTVSGNNSFLPTCTLSYIFYWLHFLETPICCKINVLVIFVYSFLFKPLFSLFHSFSSCLCKQQGSTATDCRLYWKKITSTLSLGGFCLLCRTLMQMLCNSGFTLKFSFH